MLSEVAYPLANGRVALVDGRTCRTYMHRLILGLAGSRWPLVDHADGNGLNNTRRNIAAASAALNAQKARRPAGGFRGVFRQGAGFVARSGKHYGGYFKTDREAALAYDALVVALHGERAMTNKKEGLLDA